MCMALAALPPLPQINTCRPSRHAWATALESATTGDQSKEARMDPSADAYPEGYSDVIGKGAAGWDGGKWQRDGGVWHYIFPRALSKESCKAGNLRGGVHR